MRKTTTTILGPQCLWNKKVDGAQAVMEMNTFTALLFVEHMNECYV